MLFFICTVQCWVMGNYHWYLKQSLHFNATPQDRIVSVVWDPEQAYRMHIMNADGKYMQYTWSWAIHCSSGASPEDQTITAVINGGKMGSKHDSEIIYKLSSLVIIMSIKKVTLIDMYHISKYI